MRNGADLAQAHLAVCRQVRLTARFAAAGLVEQAEAKGGDGASVAARGEEIALHPADSTIEIQGEVGARVEGIGFGRQGRAFDLGDAGQHRQRQGVGAEGEEAVAALEADFGFERDACACEPPAGPEAHRIGQTVGDAGGVGAAPHRFAMGVENQRGGIGQAMRRHRLGQPPVQPFDGERGGDLPDEAAGIGKAGLDGDAPARPRIIAIGGLTQQRIEEAPAMLHGAFGFEQRRDIDLVLDAEQPREIERGEHGLRLLAFGDQHADRRIAIDMVQDLRHRQKLADGSGALYRQRGEVAAQRFDCREQVAQAVQCGAAGEIEAVVGVDAAADGVEQLRAVHPEMNPAHAEAIGAHCGGGGQQADGAVLFRRRSERLDCGDRAGEAGQPVGMVGGDAVGGGAQRGGIVGRGGEQRGMIGGERGGGAQAGGDGVGTINAVERGGIAFEPRGFFEQAVADAGPPADVGAPVHVVPDPGSKAERHRFDGAPARRPGACGHREYDGDELVARRLGAGHSGEDVAMFGRECHRLARGVDHAHGGADIVTAGGEGDGVGFSRGQQEGRVAGEDDMLERARPACGETGEVTAFGACFDQRFEAGEIVGLGHGGEQGVEAAGAALQRLAAEVFDEGGDIVER